MTTFIKAKLKKSDDQTSIDIYRLAANITEYHIIISKLIIPKFMIRQLFHVKINMFITTIELHYTYTNRNHQTELEIDSTILTYLN